MGRGARGNHYGHVHQAPSDAVNKIFLRRYAHKNIERLRAGWGYADKKQKKKNITKKHPPRRWCSKIFKTSHFHHNFLQS
ncbi:hypothetical protein SAMN05660653_01734 [Desulfonatronum thiosulfatophilum]|uniref:Uncharacterized protein n=1 Tax=Desulfonatronum thiosulfatophilum TaxID=617002 RepID=A0A1G6CV44_9BACT|nr:hypothetical protein SAMN05660653_01734 [Desulfonatronum thiosulfatophilum]